jgi:hypothetical protein
MIPIDAEVLYSLYGSHNEATWPAPLVGYGLCLLALLLALRPFAASHRIVGAILAAAWAWNGVAFHIATFAPLNWGAWIFGAVFILEGVRWLRLAVIAQTLQFRFDAGRGGFAGVALMAFALAYPLIEQAAGHPWPQVQLPGTLPAPTMLVTLAMLAMARGQGTRRLTIIPLAWALTGGAAAVTLGIWQDVAMAAAVFAGAVLVFARARPQTVREG